MGIGAWHARSCRQARDPATHDCGTVRSFKSLSRGVTRVEGRRGRTRSMSGIGSGSRLAIVVLRNRAAGACTPVDPDAACPLTRIRNRRRSLMRQPWSARARRWRTDRRFVVAVRVTVGYGARGACCPGCPASGQSVTGRHQRYRRRRCRWRAGRDWRGRGRSAWGFGDRRARRLPGRRAAAPRRRGRR